MIEIPLTHLRSRADNANIMPEALLIKLAGHIERTGRYPHLIVRPMPGETGAYEILDGHHRAEALRRLRSETARCEVWEVDDDEALVLLATLNRLQGRDEVRRRARQYRLPNQDRPDSQGICFLGKVRYPEFIRHYLGERPGPVVELETGRELGTHRGYWFYTIGQRQGLGLAGGPWYVVAKDGNDNVIRVSHAESAGEQARDTFEVRELSWTWRPPDAGRLFVKIRHGPALTGAAVEWLGEDALKVTMETADRGVAPGQFAVFYSDEVCLGCGKIA